MADAEQVDSAEQPPSIVCDDCAATLRDADVSSDDLTTLRWLFRLGLLREELVQLRCVAAFYQRHPEAVGRIESDRHRRFFSNDPRIVEQRETLRVLLFRIVLPPDGAERWAETDEDRAAIDYLRKVTVDLTTRLPFVERSVAVGVDAPPVPCPVCHEGHLRHLDLDEVPQPAGPVDHSWTRMPRADEEPYVAGRPMLLPRSGWQADGIRWNGGRAVEPSDPDYGFWRWMVSIPWTEEECLLNDRELPFYEAQWERHVRSS